MSKLNADQRARLIEKIVPMYERGLGSSAIAERVEIDGIKLTGSTINYYITKEGAVSKRGRKKAKAAAPYIDSRGRLVRQFTPDDDIRLLDLRNQGTPIPEICRLMDRRPNSIKHRLYTLAIIEELANPELDRLPSPTLRVTNEPASR